MKILKWVGKSIWISIWVAMLGLYAYSGFLFMGRLMDFNGFIEGAMTLICGVMFVIVFLFMLSLGLKEFIDEEGEKNLFKRK